MTVVLRPTRKLHPLLPPSGDAPAQSGTALGDWYVNRITIDRRPLLLFVSSTSLLPMLVPARDVRTIPDRLAEMVAVRLRRLGIASSIIAAERAAMSSVVVAPTADRSTVGIMIEFAKMLPFHLEAGAWDDTTLPFAEAWLAKIPCHVGRPGDGAIWPVDKAPALLQAKWGGA